VTKAGVRDVGGDVTAAFRELQRTGDQRLRDQIVEQHMALATSCARRFARRGEPLDDLTQVAMFGLVKAVDRFDPERGIPFAGFAVPTIVGEVRRHFRDATWAVHVPRRTKELHLRLPAAIESFRVAESRAPSVQELADEFDVEPDEILAALDAGAAYRPTPLHAPESTAEVVAVSQVRARETLSGLDQMLIRRLIADLPERERLIVWLRFFEDLSQTEIAERVGVSQVHVSRLLRRSMRTLRKMVDHD